MAQGFVYGGRTIAPRPQMRRSTDFLSERGFGGGLAAPRPAAAPAASTPFADPNEPFAGVPDLQSGARGLLARSRGAFGPDYLRNLLRKRALMTRGNQNRRGDIMARLAGLDPQGQRQALVDTDRAASGELSRGLNEADLAGGQNWQQFLFDLLRGERGDEQGLFRQREQNRFEDSQSGGIGGFLGGALGKGIGAFTGGVGERAARRIF